MNEDKYMKELDEIEKQYKDLLITKKEKEAAIERLKHRFRLYWKRQREQNK